MPYPCLPPRSRQGSTSHSRCGRRPDNGTPGCGSRSAVSAALGMREDMGGALAAIKPDGFVRALWPTRFHRAHDGVAPWWSLRRTDLSVARNRGMERPTAANVTARIGAELAFRTREFRAEMLGHDHLCALGRIMRRGLQNIRRALYGVPGRRPPACGCTCRPMTLRSRSHRPWAYAAEQFAGEQMVMRMLVANEVSSPFAGDDLVAFLDADVVDQHT